MKPTYEEMVKLDESLDIATEIEHMIEVGECHYKGAIG